MAMPFSNAPLEGSKAPLRLSNFSQDSGMGKVDLQAGPKFKETPLKLDTCLASHILDSWPLSVHMLPWGWDCCCSASWGFEGLMGGNSLERLTRQPQASPNLCLKSSSNSLFIGLSWSLFSNANTLSKRICLNSNGLT